MFSNTAALIRKSRDNSDSREAFSGTISVVDNFYETTNR